MTIIPIGSSQLKTALLKTLYERSLYVIEGHYWYRLLLMADENRPFHSKPLAAAW
jgi:hypothetical protein